MTANLYRKHYDGRTYIGIHISDDLQVEVLRGRRAMRHIRMIAREYGVTKIRRCANRPIIG